MIIIIIIISFVLLIDYGGDIIDYYMYYLSWHNKRVGEFVIAREYYHCHGCNSYRTPNWHKPVKAHAA